MSGGGYVPGWYVCPGVVGMSRGEYVKGVNMARGEWVYYPSPPLDMGPGIPPPPTGRY